MSQTITLHGVKVEFELKLTDPNVINNQKAQFWLKSVETEIAKEINRYEGKRFSAKQLPGKSLIPAGLYQLLAFGTMEEHF